MSTLDSQLTAFAIAVGNDMQVQIETTGDKLNLLTVDKSNLVAAINEVKQIANTHEIDISDLEADVLLLIEDVGDISELDTTTKADLVSAINELVLRLNNHDIELDDLESDVLLLIEDVGDVSSLTTDYKDDLVGAINELVSKLDLGIVGSMKWLGFYTLGQAYELNNVVRDGDYLGIVTNPSGTSERLAPTDVGDPAYFYLDTMNTASNTSEQIIFGQRYTLSEDYKFSKYRVYTVIGNHYEVYSVEDPNGTPIFNKLNDFVADETGWKEFNIQEIIIPASTDFDIVAKVNEPDPTPTTFTYDYNYTTPTNFAVPTAGVAVHANKELGIIHFHKTANGSVDASVDLATLTIGDNIDLAGKRWAIQSITDNSTYYSFEIFPNEQGGSDGIQSFIFETVTATAITTAFDTDYYIADDDIQGLYIENGRWGDIVPNETAYGIDIFRQAITLSTHWDIMSIIGSGSTGGGVTALPSSYTHIQFDVANPNTGHSEGKLTWDNVNKTFLGFVDETDVALQIGRELWVRVYNDSGSAIANGKGISVTDVNGNAVPHVDLCDASDEASALAYLGISTHIIEDESFGYVTIAGFVNGVDSSALTEGLSMWNDPAVPGEFTNTRPDSPSWEVRAGGVAKSDVANGVYYSEPRVMQNTQSIIKFFNGSILDSHTVTVTSDGVTVTLSLTDTSGNGYLSLMMKEKFYKVNTPIDFILTPGTDEVPNHEAIYFPFSSLGVMASGLDYPANEQFVPVATVITPSAATVQTDGMYKVHAWTDHLADSVGQGHLSHQNAWMRSKHAEYEEGVSISFSELENVYAAFIDMITTSGVARQLHLHDFPSFDTNGGDSMYIYNDFTTKNKKISNFNSTDFALDALGNAIGNNIFNLVIWGVVSEEAKDCKWFINKPDGEYNNLINARNDIEGTTNYSLPLEYKGTAFLGYRLIFEISGGTIKLATDGIIDLRGQVPSSGGGGTIPGGGVQNWTELLDTDDSFATRSGLPVHVNFGETKLTTVPYVITWESLVAHAGRAKFQFYDITGSADPTKDYGPVQLSSADTFEWINSLKEQENIIII